MEDESKDIIPREEQVESVAVQASNCPVESVTVYRDRAEVIRNVPFTLNNTGEREIRILSLTESLNPESIRVKGLSTCQILEVSHELILTHDDQISNEAVKDMKKRITELENKQKLLQQQKQRIENQRNHVQKYTESILYGPVPGKGDGVAPARLPVAEATEILDFSFSQMASFDEKINSIEDQNSKLQEEISIVRNDMHKASRAAQGSKLNRSYTVIVLIDATSTPPGDVSIQLTYVVSDTTWTPSYDIRVSLADNSMHMSYFAEVVQSSGEDWMDCQMFLSTSNPSIAA